MKPPKLQRGSIILRLLAGIFKFPQICPQSRCIGPLPPHTASFALWSHPRGAADAFYPRHSPTQEFLHIGGNPRAHAVSQPPWTLPSVPDSPAAAMAALRRPRRPKVALRWRGAAGARERKSRASGTPSLTCRRRPRPESRSPHPITPPTAAACLRVRACCAQTDAKGGPNDHTARPRSRPAKAPPFHALAGMWQRAGGHWEGGRLRCAIIRSFKSLSE